MVGRWSPKPATWVRFPPPLPQKILLAIAGFIVRPQVTLELNAQIVKDIHVVNTLLNYL